MIGLLRKAIVNFLIRMKGNLKLTCSNSLCPEVGGGGEGGVQNKDLGAALQTLLTGVRLHLRCRLH